MNSRSFSCFTHITNKIMEELIRKFLYTGVGIVALTAEKLQEAVDEMVGKGKVSKDEGKRIVQDFVDNMESKRDDFEDSLKEAADNMTSSLKLPLFATKEDVDALMTRISSLEAKLGTESTADVKEAVAEVKEEVAKTATKARKATAAKK